MEKWTYLAAGALFILQSTIGIIFYRKSHLGDASEEKLKNEIKAQYMKYGYNETEHNRLTEELKHTKLELSRKLK